MLTVQFDLEGEYIGNYNLDVTHEPHRESKQSNVTDVLHWGDAIDEIKNNDVIGKDLTLFRDENNNFKIEIKKHK